MASGSKWPKLMSKKRYRGAAEDPTEDTVEEVRGTFFKDADRIIYSSPFRRLQDKTQVHPFPGTDYIRTRLTHSLEVSTVGRSLALSVGDQLVKRHDLNSGKNPLDRSDFGGVVAAACLAHDIGNPPFGHAGEEAIRHWFLHDDNLDYVRDISEPAQRFDLQAFEGNAQGFRLLTRLAGWRERGGLRISCATLGAFMKYPCGSLAIDPETEHESPRQKFGYFQQDKDAFRIVADTLGLKKIDTDPFRRYRHPLAYLVEAADDICYLIADLEDGFKYKKLSYEKVRDFLKVISGGVIASARLRSIRERSDKIAYLRAKAIGVLVEDVIIVFLDNEDKITNGKLKGSLLDNTKHKDIIKRIRVYCDINLYKDRAKLVSELSGFEVINDLFEIFATSLRDWESRGYKIDELHPRYQKAIRLLPGYENLPMDRYEWLLRVTDYISGMADRYALAQFQKLKAIHIETGRN
jgi:dGTPase